MTSHYVAWQEQILTSLAKLRAQLVTIKFNKHIHTYQTRVTVSMAKQVMGHKLALMYSRDTVFNHVSSGYIDSTTSMHLLLCHLGHNR